jgi:hypothetical protein
LKGRKHDVWKSLCFGHIKRAGNLLFCRFILGHNFCYPLSFTADGVVRSQGWLKGHVEIETKERVPSSGKEVIVELVGKETVCSLSHNTQNENVVFEERSVHNVIMDKDLLEPGVVHEFPFSMYLPGNIPPSMLYKDKVHLEGCSVKYTLTAQFDASTKVQEITIVGAPLSSKVYPAQVGPTVLPLLAKPTASSLSWIPHALTNHSSNNHVGWGSIVLAAKVGNAHIGKGQALKFSVAVRNRSSIASVETIQATIVERIDWDITGDEKKVSKSKRCESTCLASVNCEAGIPTLHYKKQRNDAPSTSPASSTSTSKTDVPVDDVLSSEMHGEMTSPRNTLELKVPLNARDSYAGKLLQVSHHLVITAIMATTTAPSAGGSSTSAPAAARENNANNQPSCHVEIPIKIFDPPVESHSHVATTTAVGLATTVWPQETIVPTHHLSHRSSDSCSSCASINEEPMTGTV